MNETPANKRVVHNGLSIYQIADGRIVAHRLIPGNLQHPMQPAILPPLGTHDEAAPKVNH